MVTPLGFNAASSLAAMRSGIRTVAEEGFWDLSSGGFVPVGKVNLPHWWMGLGKLAQLIAPAIHECFLAARPTEPEQIPVLIGVPGPDRPARCEGLDDSLLSEVEALLRMPLHRSSRIIARDRVSGVAGLELARALLEEGSIRHCIVAGVDSFLWPETVEAYSQRGRILTKSNSNGFSPGEAGAACLVERMGLETGDTVEVLAMSMTRETATIDSEEPLRADGLTAACRQVFAQSGLSVFEIDYRITDLNGEHYKFKEAAIADLRFVRPPKDKLYELWHPIEFMGDVGAAIGPCAFGVALHAARNGYAAGPTALLHFGSDDGERAAAIVRYVGPGGRG